MNELVHDRAEKVLDFTRMGFEALDRGDDATAAKLFKSRSGIEQRLRRNDPYELGRLLAMRSGEIPLRGASGKASGKRGVDRLTDEIHAAYGKGDKATANRLSAQRDALARELYGDV